MKRTTRWMMGCLVLVMVWLSACGPRAATPETMVATQVVESRVVVVTVEAPAEAGRDRQSLATPPPPMATAAPAPALMQEQDGVFAPGASGGLNPPNDAPYRDTFFQDYGVNPRIDVEEDNLSTFAVDVDTGAYTVMRSYINQGFLPPDASVRVEEYINYFEQGYARPTRGAFAIHLDGAPSPYAAGYHLVRVGLQGYEIPPEERKNVVLTFVVDVSGSMSGDTRLGLVLRSLEMLVESLRPEDKVGIVAYGSHAYVVLEMTPVAQRDAILRAIRTLAVEGATNAEAGLVLGYEMAARNLDPAAVNRVILCSDGVANVGATGPESIQRRIRGYTEEGIYLTTVGFGMGSYNDVLMERLANDGDGFYAYVDDIQEAERVFVHRLPSTLQVIAKDAKIQVEFNPSVVARYRLLGYENRAVADEDFRNDAVDAGEIGVGHSVTALYEVRFVEGAAERQPALTARVRYEDPDSGEVTEISQALAKADFAASFEAAAPHFQLTTVVAYYAEVLRNSYWAKDANLTLAQVNRDVTRVARLLEDPDVVEFAQLAARAAQME